MRDPLGSWFIAGFEGSTHRRRDGRRLDLVAATGHDRFAASDYRRMLRLGMRGARESLRWHRVEAQPGRYDFACEAARVGAAADAGIAVAWDLCHFGWPDHVDPFAVDFPDRFASWAFAAARFVGSRGGAPQWFTPINEISFLAWAGGQVGYLNPHATRRGAELKRQLVRATILAIDAIRAELPNARFLQPEPLIKVHSRPGRPQDRRRASRETASQFEAWEMISGRRDPELGGSERDLDVLGANYYPANQWFVGGEKLTLDSPLRTPFSELLRAVHARFGRDIVIAETGTEDALRGRWLRSIEREVAMAVADGVPIRGICLYPILNHPGWDDDRHCRNGLWDYPGPRGGRRAHRPLVRIIGSRTDAVADPPLLAG